MNDEVARYNKIYTDKPEKWADGPGVFRDYCAYSVISRHIEPETLLDIGCGNGHTINYFQKKWPDTLYYGIDLSDVAIEIAREKVPDAVFMAGDFKEVTLTCDVVTVMGVAEHFEKLVDGLRSLKDYGKLIYMEVPDCLWVDKLNGSPNNEEGFRETFFGGLQVEWHLNKRSWEERIGFAGLEILEFSPGADPFSFVWMLR